MIENMMLAFTILFDYSIEQMQVAGDLVSANAWAAVVAALLAVWFITLNVDWLRSVFAEIFTKGIDHCDR